MPDLTSAAVTSSHRSDSVGDGDTVPVPTASRADSDRRNHDRAVTLGELLLLAAATVVALVALVSLAAAHLHHHTPLVVSAGSVVAVLAAGLVVFRWDRPAIRLDLTGLIPIVVGLGFAAVMMFPGFQYATGDRDPGAYVETAVAIQHYHSVEFPDDLVQAGLPGGVSPGAEWPAIWDKPGHPGIILPQFYHLWPALLATAKDAGGFTGLFNTGPLLGVIAVGLAVAVARRLAGWPAAWAAAVLLSSNMLEVWQAKYPTAEIFGQLLFVGALLGVVLAIRTGWKGAAAAAGVLVGLGYLERADGIIVVLMAWAFLAALVAIRRFDARAAWFGGGLLAVLPYGFYQAYVVARAYTLANAVPSFAKVLAAMLALALVGLALAWQRTLAARVVSLADNGRRRLLLGLAFVGICGLLGLIGGLRPKLFGRDYFMYAGKSMRSYDEISLIRLSWFFSLPGLFLMFAGVMFVALRTWRFDRWVVAIPTVALLVLYCYHAKNSAYMMWSTRRFVTTVVPGMVLLMGCGAALIVYCIRRYLPRLPQLVAVAVIGVLLAGLTVFNLRESVPLRNHNENGGSIEVEQAIARLAGDQKGVFLWERSAYCCNAPYQLFGGPLFTILDQSSAVVPATASAVPGALKTYVDHFAGTGRPVFYVADKKHTPPVIAGVTATKALQLVGSLPHWEETFVSRPKKTKDYPYDMTVYRLTKS
ncbi:MAG: hypothetical protein QOE89_3453 [Pseudonocardiales bacterium]|nr:hypothetical protein [Pseudonocardiales bacterium]